MKRAKGREHNKLRQVKITKDYIKHAEGSVLIEMGDTKVICTATVEENVPPFLKGKGVGWITAEYGMLPRSANVRIVRESIRGRVSGRTQEIQRLIGRSLRAVINMKSLGERTFLFDCDVIQADGGTRTASITGSYIALVDAVRHLNKKGIFEKDIIKEPVAAISVGIVGGNELLDLNYAEDSNAEVDMNVVMTAGGNLIEVQGTGEKGTFTKEEMDRLIALAQNGIEELILIQGQVLENGVYP